jgi:hypothetical protein
VLDLLREAPKGEHGYAALHLTDNIATSVPGLQTHVIDDSSFDSLDFCAKGGEDSIAVHVGRFGSRCITSNELDSW